MREDGMENFQQAVSSDLMTSCKCINNLETETIHQVTGLPFC